MTDTPSITVLLTPPLMRAAARRFMMRQFGRKALMWLPVVWLLVGILLFYERFSALSMIMLTITTLVTLLFAAVYVITLHQAEIAGTTFEQNDVELDTD